MAVIGDIALVGYSSDTIGKSFSFVLLADLSGQTLNFTDNGWFAAGGFRANEGTTSYTVPAGTPIGTVVTIGGLTSTFNPSTNGDQILAYFGSASSPTFLFALDFADGNATYAGDATNSNTSAVPTGLVFGDTALAFGLDNGAYTGPLTGTKAQILANIATTSNWTLDDAALVSYPSAFTVGGGGGGGGATLSIGDVSISEGNSGTSIATFTVTLSTAQASDVFVDFATSDGTATAGSDYVATSGNLQFTAGETSKTIQVTVNGDTAVELNELFNITLSNVTGAADVTIADGSGVGTINNDDISTSATLISTIQGDAFFSPVLAAEGIAAFNVASAATVTVSAVVTAIDTQRYGPRLLSV